MQSTGFFRETFNRVDAEAAAYRVEHPGFDRQVAVVLLVATVCLTIQEYFFRKGSFTALIDLATALGLTQIAERLGSFYGDSANQQLADLLWWAMGTYLTYVVIPAFFVSVVFRQRLRDYGLKLRGMFSGAWVYLIMLAVMFPLLWHFSKTAEFQARYPFYNLAPGEPLWPRLFVWEMAYVLQFVALEFFFRGFLIHGTRRSLGVYSIFVMTVPYCMIHFGKPLPETCGAIAAGVALGFMSLKTRSIWLGAGLHIAVALTMDSLSLWRQGLL